MALIVAGLVALVLRLTLFQTGLRHVPVSSDESITALQAIGITQSSHDPAFDAKQSPRGLKGRFPLLFMAQPYLFPLEAYLMAPLMPVMPRNAFGARFTALLIGFAGVLAGLLLLRRWGAWREIWPGVLLVMLPSAYVLILQAGYALPSYPVLIGGSMVILLLIHLMHRDEKARPWTALVAGICTGLLFCASLLSLPVTVMAGVMALAGGSWRKARWEFPAAVLGWIIGAAPFFLATKFYPGAFGAVSTLIPWGKAIERLWAPTLTFTLPVTLGATPCYWPDNDQIVTIIPGLGKVFPWIWIITMGSAIIFCFVGFLRRSIKQRWPSVTVMDAFVAMSVMALWLFAINYRSSSHAYRYLLLPAICFPFIVARLYQAGGLALRWIIGVLAMALACVNLIAGIVVMRNWVRSDFAAEEAWLGDIKPLIEGLKKEGIRYAYASYHLAYRITYASDEKIICSQFFNERFPPWPLPYKEAVDRVDMVAFIFSHRYSLRAADFARDLEAAGIRARRERWGEYEVFWNFMPPAEEWTEKTVPLAGGQVTVSHNKEQAENLIDGEPSVRWRALHAQEKGMLIEIGLEKARHVMGVRLDYGGYAYDQAQKLQITVRSDNGSWVTMMSPVVSQLDPVVLKNGHPVMSMPVQTIRFQTPTFTDGVRIEIETPTPKRDWTIGEITLLEKKAP